MNHDMADRKVVLAYYYIWFTKGWFGGSETPDLKEAMGDIHPAIGPYNSSDREVIAEHVRQSKAAGLDALAVSWLRGTRNRDGVCQDDILDDVVEIAADQGLKVCIDLEALGCSPDRIYEALEYYLNRYQGDDRMLTAEGKVTALLWGTWAHPPEVWEEIFDRLRSRGLEGFYIPSNQMEVEYLSALRGLEKYTPLVEDVSGLYQEGIAKVRAHNQNLPAGARRARWHATIMPGFDDRAIPGRLANADYIHCEERREGVYYRKTFEAAMASDPDWLHLTSFNELAEHSHIEATEEFGDEYIRMTARFADQFRAGA